MKIDTTNKIDDQNVVEDEVPNMFLNEVKKIIESKGKEHEKYDNNTHDDHRSFTQDPSK